MTFEMSNLSNVKVKFLTLISWYVFCLLVC